MWDLVVEEHIATGHFKSQDNLPNIDPESRLCRKLPKIRSTTINEINSLRTVAANVFELGEVSDQNATRI